MAFWRLLIFFFETRRGPSADKGLYIEDLVCFRMKSVYCNKFLSVGEIGGKPTIG